MAPDRQNWAIRSQEDRFAAVGSGDVRLMHPWSNVAQQLFESLNRQQ